LATVLEITLTNQKDVSRATTALWDKVKSALERQYAYIAELPQNQHYAFDRLDPKIKIEVPL
jgi:hypothetical protein